MTTRCKQSPRALHLKRAAILWSSAIFLGIFVSSAYGQTAPDSQSTPVPGEQAPSLIIMDLNNASVKPVPTITKLKSKLKKQTNIIGFLSHVQGDIKLKAQEAGCDMVLPRSAFSQNLPQLLRRHGASTELQ